MKLLFVNQYYKPDSAATAQVMSDLCEHLAEAGHEVHVYCSRGSYEAGSSLAGKRMPGRQTLAGVHVHRLAATGFAKRGRFGRILDYATFHAHIGLRTLVAGWRYDAIITLTTPPLVGIYATLVSKLARARHLCWVMDLHPDCEFELGVMNPRRPLPRLLQWLNDMHLRQADACVVLGRYMGKRLEAKRVDPRRIHEIGVWGLDVERDGTKQAALRQTLGLTGKFVIMYSGNAGLIHTFDEICAAMHELRHDDRFVFLIAGSGRRMDEVRAFAQSNGLSNVQFHGYFPREQLGQSLAVADVHLVTLRDNMAGVAVPSKLYGVMAAGRPVVFIGPEACETADHIRDHHCGVTLCTGDVPGFIATLRRLAADKLLRQELNASARRAYETTFNAHVGCTHWQKLIEAFA